MVLNGNLVNHCFLLVLETLSRNLLAATKTVKTSVEVSPLSLVLPTSIFFGQLLHGVCLHFCLQRKVVVICAGWWSLKSTLGQPPVPAQLYLVLKTLSSHPYLQTQLTGKGGQIPRKERWLN